FLAAWAARAAAPSAAPGAVAAGAEHKRPPPSPRDRVFTVHFFPPQGGGRLAPTWTALKTTSRSPPAGETAKTPPLQGQGPGGGDLHLKIHVEDHPYFRREGSDVILTVPLSVSEAVVGCRIDVPTLDGTKLTVKIPPGTSSGARLRLRGKGIKGGDQY